MHAVQANGKLSGQNTCDANVKCNLERRDLPSEATETGQVQHLIGQRLAARSWSYSGYDVVNGVIAGTDSGPRLNWLAH